jgi:hypothetical protein
MRKYISVQTTTTEEGGLNINVNVLDDPIELMFVSCGGYIETSDLDDLYTPASLMVQKLTGEYNEPDEELIENLAEAFRKILTPRPTITINGEFFA